MAPEAKVAAAFLLVLSFAITPREAFWAFGVHAALLTGVVLVSDLPLRFVVTRMASVLPFITFAFLIPFIGSGERIEVLGIGMSRDGLWGTWNIVAKAGLGITVSVLLAGTTQESRILVGLERLRVPPVLTQIASFMLRYLSLLAGELGRMRVAMTARGYDPRWIWQAKPIAASAGALFIRGYERGERIHGAMLSRGYTGTMPVAEDPRATPRQWAAVAAAVTLSTTVAVTALVTT